VKTLTTLLFRIQF